MLWMIRHRHAPELALFAVLLLLVGLTVQPYAGNITALFHMDEQLAASHPVPQEFVVLQMPGYDGMHYYQIARDIPRIANPAEWPALGADNQHGSYAYQRFLLPLAAFVLSLGQTALLPWAFLLINIGSIIGAFAIARRRWPSSILPALAIALSPAAMVGLHFSLAEPLSLLLLTAFLARYTKHERVGWTETGLLSLLVLAREVHILFWLGIVVFSLLRKRWLDVARLLIPLLVFLALHSLIFDIFQEVPFLLSAAKRTPPFGAAIQLVGGRQGYNLYTASSIALLLLFVLPALLLSLRRWVRSRGLPFIPVMLSGFLLVMLAMPDFIWGSITSIGRVITPVYPLFAVFAAQHPSPTKSLLCRIVVLLGLAAGAGLAFIPHPFVLS